MVSCKFYLTPILVAMMMALRTIVLVEAAPRAFHASGSNMNMTCATGLCGKEMARAMVDRMFFQGAMCQLGCGDVYKHDTTPSKLQYQNCTTKCALSYESEAGDAFLNCAMANNCVVFPEIKGSCPKPFVDPESSLANLSGEWWQAYGKNALWDCYPCQHIHQMKLVNDSSFCALTFTPNGPVQAPCWGYTYSYDLYTERGSKYFGQTWQLPIVEKGKPIEIFYTYMGSTHIETWYILRATSRYVVLVDCSYMNTWINVGSIVWVRPNVVLTRAEMTTISTLYKLRLGWSFPDEFCVNRHGDAVCDGPYHHMVA